MGKICVITTSHTLDVEKGSTVASRIRNEYDRKGYDGLFSTIWKDEEAYYRRNELVVDQWKDTYRH